MSDEYEGPCRICGSEVSVIRVPGQMTIADRVPPIETQRRCTNVKCASNTGGMTLTDVV